MMTSILQKKKLRLEAVRSLQWALLVLQVTLHPGFRTQSLASNETPWALANWEGGSAYLRPLPHLFSPQTRCCRGLECLHL